MSYRVLRDYGAYEGMKLAPEVFTTVDEAVKAAIADFNHAPFFVVQVIDWEAQARLGDMPPGVAPV